MVCSKCEAKLSRLVVAEKKWGSGIASGVSSAAPTGAQQARSAFSPCRACKAHNVHLPGAAYCQRCAYTNAICACCGTKMLDTSAYKMSSK